MAAKKKMNEFVVDIFFGCVYFVMFFYEKLPVENITSIESEL